MTPRRVALVTGAAAGIGKAISLRLAQDGMAVGVLDIDPEGCLGVAAQISESVGQAIALPASVADRAELTAAAATSSQVASRGETNSSRQEDAA